MKKTIEIGNKVAFNTLPDATWFDVVAVNGFTLTVRETGTDYAVQVIDRCAVKAVTR